MIRNKKARVLCSIFLTVLLFVSAMCCIFYGKISKAFGDAVKVSKVKGITGSPSGSSLYYATNTYDYKGDNISADRKYEYYDTSTFGRNTNAVATRKITNNRNWEIWFSKQQ